MIDRVVIPLAGDYTPAAIVAAHSLCEQQQFSNPGSGRLLFFAARGLCDECRAQLPKRVGAWECEVWEPDDSTPELPSLDLVGAKYAETRDKLLIHALPRTKGMSLMLDADTAAVSRDVEQLHEVNSWAACLNPSVSAHSQLLDLFSPWANFNSGVVVFDCEPERASLFYEWLRTVAANQRLKETPNGDELWHNLAWHTGVLPMPVALHPRWNWTGMSQRLMGNDRYDEIKPPIIHATGQRWRKFRPHTIRTRLHAAYERAAEKAGQGPAERRRSCCREPTRGHVHQSRKARRSVAAARRMARRNAAR